MSEKTPPIHILLIDKTPRNITRFVQALKAAKGNFAVHNEPTLRGGVKRLAKNAYDIIFVDHAMLCAYRGAFVCEARAHNPKTPIMVMADKTDEEARQRLTAERSVYWIDHTLITPEGLGHIVPHTVRYVNLKQTNETLENNIAPMMNFLPMFIFFIDRAGIIRYAKGQSLDHLALSGKKHFVNRPIYEVAKGHPAFLRHLKRAFKGKQVSGVDLLIKNTVFDVSCIPVINDDQQVEGVYGIAKDCTKRATDQKGLLRAKKETERNAMMKEQFSATISHEIRTPLNAIIGFSALLMDETLTQRQRLYVKSIRQSGENLLSIVNGVLDLSKLGAKKMSLKKAPFDLRETIKILEKTILLQMRETFVTLSVKVEDDVPRHVVGDSVRLYQILLNLLSNAVKFTERGGIYFSISVEKAARKNILLRFKVRDTGIGIPKREQPRIFERFSQVDIGNDYVNKHNGAGLGLSIVKRLVELYKGVISLQSKEGKGSTFSVALPFTRHHAEAPQQDVKPQKVASAVQLDGVRVLLVEDNAMNELLASTLLTSWKMKVDTASNGKEALEKISENRYDIVLMDVQMPVLSGIEATQKIRETYAASSLPIVAMSAHALPAEKKKCKDVGMNGYITKPYQIEEVRDTICRLLADGVPSVPVKVAKTQTPKPKSERTPKPTSKPKRVEAKPEALCNLDALRQITHGDEQLKQELVQMYLKAADHAAIYIPECCSENNFPELRAILHKFLSAVNTFGIRPLSVLIGEILDQEDERILQEPATKKRIAKILQLIKQSKRELQPPDKPPLRRVRSTVAARHKKIQQPSG